MRVHASTGRAPTYQNRPVFELVLPESQIVRDSARSKVDSDPGWAIRDRSTTSRLAQTGRKWQLRGVAECHEMSRNVGIGWFEGGRFVMEIQGGRSVQVIVINMFMRYVARAV